MFTVSSQQVVDYALCLRGIKPGVSIFPHLGEDGETLSGMMDRHSKAYQSDEHTHIHFFTIRREFVYLTIIELV